MASTSTPQLPKTYKAAVIEAPNQPLKIKELELKLPQEGEVLVKVAACGVCHSDEAVRTGMMGQTPIVPGHELIGSIVALGPNTSKQWQIGDRVGGAWHGGHDGTCKACRRGFFQTCANEAINGVTRAGGYAQYCVLRSEAVVRIPADIEPADYAPLLCAGVTVFNSIRNMRVAAGELVAVQGLGGLGHLALQYARRMGYRVVAVSRGEAKRKFAMGLGAHEYVNGEEEDVAQALQRLGGAALVVVTAPSKDVVGGAVEGCAAGGKVLVLAPVGEIPVNTITLITKGISVCGWPSGHALDSEEAIAFAQHQDVKCMVEKFPLEKAQEAMDHMLSGKVRFRAVLTME